MKPAPLGSGCYYIANCFIDRNSRYEFLPPPPSCPPFPPPVFPFRSCRYHLTLTDTCNVCNGLATEGPGTGKRMSHQNTSLSRNIIDGTGGDGIWALGHYGVRYRLGVTRYVKVALI